MTREEKYEEVLWYIGDELVRQDRLKAEGRFRFTCADDGLSAFEKLAILTEELGEVARAIQEEADNVTDIRNVQLFTELVQVAAVAASWASSVLPEDKA